MECQKKLRLTQKRARKGKQRNERQMRQIDNTNSKILELNLTISIIGRNIRGLEHQLKGITCQTGCKSNINYLKSCIFNSMTQIG